MLQEEQTSGESSALSSPLVQESAMSSSLAQVGAVSTPSTTEIVVNPEDALAERVPAIVLKTIEG